MHLLTLAVSLVFVSATLPFSHLLASSPADDYQETLVAFKSGKLEQALQLADAYLIKNPDPKGLELKGRILHAQGKYNEAETFYFSALEKNPDMISPHFHLGEAAFKRRAWSESIQYFRYHLSKSQDSKNSILKLIYSYLVTGNYPEAARWLTALDPVDETNPAYYFARAATAYSNQKNQEYKDVLQQARTIYGNDVFNSYEPDLLFLLKNLSKQVE